MAYRYGNCYQMTLLPMSIEDYDGADHPARRYDAFIESLHVEKVGIQTDSWNVSNAEYDPIVLCVRLCETKPNSLLNEVVVLPILANFSNAPYR